MAGNPQTQTFTYDSLNRLTSAQATGGTIGNYAQQSYTYNATTGNLATKAGVSYGYNDAAHAHAVTHLGGVQKYGYDANGNQTKRIIGADTYDLAYDAENRLVEVKKNSSVYATFVYNADGQRVNSSVNGVSIGYIGSYAEWTSSALTSYYYAGAAQIAMRQSGELIYMFGDDPSHSFGTSLGSTSKTYQVSNGETKMQLYYPWGERRYPTAASEINTRYRYTGQYEYSEFGLYFYQSRWYDASLGRFAQADTIIPNPGDNQSWDRYAYVRNNPLRYVDPTGHRACDDIVNGVCITWSANYVLDKFNIKAKDSSKKWDQVDAALVWTDYLWSQGNQDPIKAFHERFPEQIILIIDKNFVPDGDPKANCETIDNTITCRKSPGVANTLHELFHVLDKHYKNLRIKGELLISNELPLDYYYLDAYTIYAFACSNFACLDNKPKGGMIESFEQFANMGENWLLEGRTINGVIYGFATNYEGDNLRYWMNNDLKNYLNLIVQAAQAGG